MTTHWALEPLLLIDLSGLFWTNWHATADKEIGAAFDMTLAKVHRYASQYKLVTIACDAPPYKRKELYPEYKAQRDTPAQDALDQFRRIKDRLAEDGYLLWSAQGYEADDVIATACSMATLNQIKVDILSQDKDLVQLVSDELNVTVINPRTGDRFSDEGVFAKFGVLPDRVGDLLALVGDKSDNVPGVPGIGAVKAAALLQQWGCLDELQRAISDGDSGEEIKPPAVRRALLDNAEQLEVSRRLVALERNLPIEFDDLFKDRERKEVVEREVSGAEFDDEPPKPEPASVVVEQVVEQKPEPQEAPKPQAIVQATGQWNQALEPTTSRGAWALANAMFESRAFGVANAQTALAVIMKGRSLGLDAVTSLTNFHIIEGKPSMSAQLIIGMVKASPLCRFFRLVKTTNELAVWETHRVGEPDPISLDWTIEDARTAQLTRGSRSGRPTQWDKMPRTMLRWRCGVELARAVYPDVVAGVYSTEEMQDVIDTRGISV
jgi:5'-3' exonuclease